MKIKVLAIIMALLTLSLSFTSCNQNGSADNGTENDAVKVIDSEYAVVRANNADDLTIDAAMKLRELINEKSSLDISIKSDFLKKDEEAPKKEILVGQTNRETKFDRTTLTEGQYYVGIEDSRVIVDAYDALTLYLAISDIVDNWLELGGGVFTLDENTVSMLGNAKVDDMHKIKILSQNVRYADDGNGNNISERAPRLRKLVEKYQPDIIGTQETTALWNRYFNMYFKKEYGMVGCSRDGKDATSGEWGTILYRLDRFELLDNGDFWLSETPDKVSGVSGTLCNRICTWALLKDKNTGETLVMANTHLDHGTDEVRNKQLRYLLQGLSEFMNEYPIYITGDFNANPSSTVYKAATNVLCDPYTDAFENQSQVNYTYHAYGKYTSEGVIDYCFYNDRSIALSYKILDEQFDGYVSDHYGIITEFVIK